MRRFAILGVGAVASAVSLIAGLVFGWSRLNQPDHRPPPLSDQWAQTERALSADPGNFDLRYQQANQLIDLGDLENARASARSMGLGAQSARDHYALGRLFMRLADYQQAEEQFYRIKDDQRFGAATLTHRAENFARAGQRQAAVGVLDAGPDTASRRYIRARLAHGAGDLEGAREAVASLLHEAPQDARYWALLAQITLDQQDLETASTAAKQMRQSGQYRLRADLVDVAIAVREGRLGDGQTVFAELAARHPNAPIMGEMRGFLAVAAGAPGEAVDAYTQAASTLPAEGLRALRLAAARFAKGDEAQADLFVQKAVSAAPENWIAHALAIEFDLRRMETAAQEGALSADGALTALTAFAPGPEHALTARLRLAARTGDWLAARDALDALADFGMRPADSIHGAEQVLFGPNTPFFETTHSERRSITTLQHAVRLRRAGDLEKAYALVTTGTGERSTPLAPLFLYMAADFALDLFRTDEAAEHLGAAQTLTGQTLLGTLLQARMIGGGGDHDGAIATLMVAADQFGPSAKNHVLGTLLTMGEGARALALFEASSPDDFEADHFARLVDWCLPRGASCLGEGGNDTSARAAMGTRLLQVSGTYTGTRAGDATLIRLKETIAPTPPDWELYRAFYDAYGQSSAGRTRFVTLVADAKRWREAQRFVAAINRKAARSDSKSHAVYGLLLEAALKAKRARRGPDLLTVVAAFPDHPAVLAASLDALSRRGLPARLKKAYAAALVRALTTGVDLAGVDIDGVHLVRVLERSHKKCDRRRFPSIDPGSNARTLKNPDCVFESTKSKRSLGRTQSRAMLRQALAGHAEVNTEKSALMALAAPKKQLDHQRQRALDFFDAQTAAITQNKAQATLVSLRQARQAFFVGAKTAARVEDYAQALAQLGFADHAKQVRGQWPRASGGTKGS
ncbi:MAG: tetratricopeptide repeat protein [Pseudomonadota bacterium]